MRMHLRHLIFGLIPYRLGASAMKELMRDNSFTALKVISFTQKQSLGGALDRSYS